MTRYILLLRGINVSGANIIKMADFRAFLSGLGFESVESYIQSGNAVFSSLISSDEVHELVLVAFPARFGFSPKMMLVSVEELAAVRGGNPFDETSIDPARLHVGFLAQEPGREAVTALAAKTRTSEEYQIKGRVFYLITPDGLGKSKFAASVEKTLKVPVTFRNWRTVNVLADMAANPKPQ